MTRLAAQPGLRHVRRWKSRDAGRLCRRRSASRAGRREASARGEGRQRVGAEEFYATTYRKRNPRMRSLFDRFGFAASADPDDAEVVVYRATVGELSVRHAGPRAGGEAATRTPRALASAS